MSVAVFVWFTVAPHPGRTTEGVGAIVFGLAVLAIPVAAGIAILRHRLYDIDVLISKTLVYGGLAAFVTGIYVLFVTVIGTAIGRRGDLALSVLATTIAAAAFHPLHARLTRVANRLVFGERARPIELLTELSRTMAGTHELDNVLSSTARIVATGVGATRGLVWVRQGNTLVPAGEWPPAVTASPRTGSVTGEILVQIDGEDGAWPVHHQQHLLGAISVVMPAGVELSSVQHRQLEQLAWAAGLVLENVRLVDELRASRTRIVVAQDAERKRIERDLHDGAQQRLLTASLALGVARAEATGLHAPRLQDALDQATAQAHEALDELRRRLARGIHPAILTDRGLVPAVRSLLEQAPLPAVLAASPQLGARRLPAAIEAAAYFVVAEAVANSLKHATPSKIDVELAQPDGALLVRICDDGAGGAAWRPGGGLQGLGDRVAVLGGRLELDSEAHRGTRVTAVLPCA
jgi:signal transduction histidine kinase